MLFLPPYRKELYREGNVIYLPMLLRPIKFLPDGEECKVIKFDYIRRFKLKEKFHVTF